MITRKQLRRMDEARAQRGREYRFGWTVARDGCRPGLVATEHERAGYKAALAHYAALARVEAQPSLVLEAV